MILLTIIALAFLLHLTFAMLLSRAVQDHRIEIAQGYRHLIDMNAPEWLTDLWASAIPATFRTGLLRSVVWQLAVHKKDIRPEIAQWLAKVRHLPHEQRQLHDKMDRHFAVVLAANAPYTMMVLFLYALIHRKTIKLSQIIPHRDMRASMAAH